MTQRGKEGGGGRRREKIKGGKRKEEKREEEKGERFAASIEGRSGTHGGRPASNTTRGEREQGDRQRSARYRNDEKAGKDFFEDLRAQTDKRF